MTASRAPILNVLPAALTLILLAGCGSGDDRRSAAPAGSADRAARAYEHAKALEENAARLEAELARLSGEPPLETPPEPVPPAAAATPPSPAVVATAGSGPRPRPHAAPAPVAPALVRTKKTLAAPPSAKPGGPQPTAGEVQRAIASGGLLSDDQTSPKLDYNGMP